MNMISVKQLREEFPKVKEKIKKGEKFLLIYRSQPLAEIRPINSQNKQDIQSREEVTRIVRELAGGSKLGIGLSADEMNQSYDEGVYRSVLS